MARRTARGRRSVARGFIAQLPALLRSIGVFGAVLACGSVAWAQSADGARPVQIRTITGRRPSGPDHVTGRGPSISDVLRDVPHRRGGVAGAKSRRPAHSPPQAIIDSLLTGAMRPQGSRLSGPERRAVAEFITGKTPWGDVSGALTGRCTSSWPLQDFAKTPQWAGWSPSTTNTVSACGPGGSQHR